MQAKAVREKNVEFFNNVVVKVEIPEKSEKLTGNVEPRSDATNAAISKEPVDKDEFLPYERKYFSLLHRCELLKQSNERLVNRIYYVKKLLRRRKKERKFLMDRLDGYGDDYITVAAELFSETIGDSSPTRLPTQENSKSDALHTGLLLQIKTEPDT